MIDSANEVIVSVASAWEVGIKVAGGKLVLPQTLEGWLGTALSGFDVLPIGLDHVRLAVRLPMHHKDPFDRVLVAQALAEGLTLVTADPQVQLYGAPILPADA
jgi:PIN domain nuclease of toxin-antitoxin system